MAISIDWGNRVIYVPKADLTLIQETPTEIRELNLNTFRLALKDLEDSEEGMCFPDTHRHNTEVSVAGMTLARVIEIINGYTVTFEDGQYAVNLPGANSNVGDVVNVNQVSVRTFNSAGLISSPAIEYASYENQVSIDVGSPWAGTTYPIGTNQKPVNNVADALLIAEARGFDSLHLKSNLTTNQDLHSFLVSGETVDTVLTLEPGCLSPGCSFRDLTITGEGCDMPMSWFRCNLENLVGVQGFLFECALSGEIVLSGTNSNIISCYSGRKLGFGRTVIDMGTVPGNLQVRNFAGGIKLKNYTFPNNRVIMDFNSGLLEIDSTCTDGELVVRGVGEIIDNGGPNLIRDFHMVNPQSVSIAVLDEGMSAHTTVGTLGELLHQLKDETFGRWVVDIVAKTMTLYKSNGDVLKVFDLTSTDETVPVFIERVPR